MEVSRENATISDGGYNGPASNEEKPMKRLKLAVTAIAGLLTLSLCNSFAQEVRIAHIYSKTGPLEAYG